MLDGGSGRPSGSAGTGAEQGNFSARSASVPTEDTSEEIKVEDIPF
jgi:hypothetical protein